MKTENWIKWDLDSRGGIKMASYFADTGSGGYGFFLVIIEMLYRSGDHKLRHDEIGAYAKICKLMQDDADAYLCSAVACKLLQSDAIYFWSERVHAELMQRELRIKQVSESRRNSANIRWEKAKESEKLNARAMQNDANDARSEKRRVDKNRSNTNTITPKTEFAPLVFLTQEQNQNLVEGHGADFVKQCYEKLSAWIEQDPTPKRKKKGQNASATLRTWVINAVTDDQRRASSPINGKLIGSKSWADDRREKNQKILEEARLQHANLND